MKKYTVTTTEKLRALCIENNWFTCGDNRQYEKLFYANENGCSIEEIATIIWLCSDDECYRRDILFELQEARIDFWKNMFGVEDASIKSAQEAIEKVVDTKSLINMYILHEICQDYDISFSSFNFSLDMNTIKDRYVHLTNTGVNSKSKEFIIK